MKSRLCILYTLKRLKTILDSEMASKMKNIDTKKITFYHKEEFHQKKNPLSLIGSKPFNLHGMAF